MGFIFQGHDPLRPTEIGHRLLARFSGYGSQDWVDSSSWEVAWTGKLRNRAGQVWTAKLQNRELRIQRHVYDPINFEEATTTEHNSVSIYHLLEELEAWNGV